MSKCIKVTIVESAIQAVAELYEEDAPRTSASMWQLLKDPIEQRARHSMWCGRKITVDVPESHRIIDPSLIPRENSTAYPVAGDLLWNFWPPRAVRGFPAGVWDVMIIYGPEAIMKGPLGIEPCNLWAHIIEGYEDFARDCRQFRSTGTKTLRLERL